MLTALFDVMLAVFGQRVLFRDLDQPRGSFESWAMPAVTVKSGGFPRRRPSCASCVVGQPAVLPMLRFPPLAPVAGLWFPAAADSIMRHSRSAPFTLCLSCSKSFVRTPLLAQWFNFEPTPRACRVRRAKRFNTPIGQRIKRRREEMLGCLGGATSISQKGRQNIQRKVEHFAQRKKEGKEARSVDAVIC